MPTHSSNSCSCLVIFGRSSLDTIFAWSFWTRHDGDVMIDKGVCDEIFQDI